MKKIIDCCMVLLIAGIVAIAAAQTPTISLYEEDRAFWDKFLKESNCANCNLLYASFVAYNEKLTDLSIETFRECLGKNPTNERVLGIANYYIGKNLFRIGNYAEAITQFTLALNYELLAFNHVKTAIRLNMAIAYFRLNDIKACRQHLQAIIDTDRTGTYKKVATEVLSQIP